MEASLQNIVENQPYLTLSNGRKVPQIGLGTFLASEGDVQAVVKSAILEHGYRHIDTAKVYQNEDKIGVALQECFAAGIKREDLFITTKLWTDDFHDPESAIKTSLQKLQLDYVDLYLIHWTFPNSDWEQGKVVQAFPMQTLWKKMEELVDKNLTKSIGVSNCQFTMFLDILTYAKHQPVTNQIELHPYLAQEKFVKYHTRFGSTVTAYAPLGAAAWEYKNPDYNGVNVLKDPLILELSNKYGKGVGQVILNWHVRQGHIVIPKTSNLNRLRENIEFFDFKMEESEYEAITKLDRNMRLYDPAYMKVFGWDNTPYFQ